MGQNTAAYKGLMAHMDMIRQYQSIEGMTVMDAEDIRDPQLHVRRAVRRSGAVRPAGRRRGRNSTGAPVRPVTGGFSTGETDLSNYYDNVSTQQERRLRAAA
ncbi:DUF1073 domain-containing protein [Serratia ureilytica]